MSWAVEPGTRGSSYCSLCVAGRAGLRPDPSMRPLQPLPRRFKTARMCRVLRHSLRPGHPSYLLFHTLSGFTLQVDVRMLKTMEWISRRSRVEARQLLEEFSFSSERDLEALRPLFEARFLIPAGIGDEFDLFLDYFPLPRRRMLYLDDGPGGTLTVTNKTQVPGQPSKIEEFRLRSEAAAVFRLCNGKRRLHEIISM